MWHPETAVWEILLRALIVYGFVITLLRLTGKRQIGQMEPFDLVLLMLLSNSVQNSMNAGDNSLTTGLISAGMLIAINYAVDFIAFRSKKAGRFIEGVPKILVHNGQIYEAVLRRENITHIELNAALRAGGCLRVNQVRVAVLETNGNISVVAREPESKDAPTRQEKKKPVA